MGRWLLQVGLALLGAVGMLILAPPGVEAHALLRSSDPPEGAELQRAPHAVTITFTEEPEAEFAIVQLLDVSGRVVPGTGRPVAASGQPSTLRVPLGPLGTGIYTVSWRVVSRVDGHLTGGTFAFGVGVSPLEAPQLPSSSPPLSPWATPGKIALYIGAMGLLGSAWVWALAAQTVPVSAGRLLWLFWAAAAAGLVTVAQAQHVDAGVSWVQLFGSAIGRGLWLRGLPLGFAAVGIALIGRLAARTGRIVLLAIGASAAAVMLAHVAAGHAGAAGDWRAVKILIQWTHFMGVGVWIGGLAALLVTVRGTPDEAKARLARCFSTVAGVALAVVALSGVLRAVDEVGTFSRLLTTPFGQLVVLKSALLLILAMLGAVNRYWSLPAAGQALQRLRRVAGVELGVAALVLLVTGLLTGLAPASYTQEAAGQAANVVGAGADYATSVRANLEVAPGYPGPNRFVVALRDYDTGMPLKADRVSLRFVLGNRPDIAPSTLPLTPGGEGTYRSQGSNLSLDGKWTVTVVVERGANSTEVPISVTTRSRPQQVRTIRAPGQPTLYVIDFPDKRSVQVYIDPERPGSTQVHVTYFDDRGNELPIAREITLRMTQGDRPTQPIPVRRFGPGHFIGDATVEPGSLRMELEATDPQGAPLRAALLIQL